MEIFGIGLTELLFIVIIILIIFGPADLAKNSGEIGRFLNKVVRSDTWRAMQKTTSEVKKIPTALMREANLQDFEEERLKLGQDLHSNPDVSVQDMLGRRSLPGGGPENRVASTAQPNSSPPPDHDPDEKT